VRRCRPISCKCRALFLFLFLSCLAFENCFLPLLFHETDPKKKRQIKANILVGGVEGCDWEGASFCIKVATDSEYKTKA